MKKSIILLSGGLDSLVSIGLAKEDYNIELALTFDYGQKAVEKEIVASKKIADFYKLEHKVIKLDWLKEITTSALVGEKEVPRTNLNDLASDEFTQKSAVSVWVPNRNGAFLNIAAAFADAYDYTHIIFGANKEEGVTFPDNTQDFIDRLNESLAFSTLKKPKVIAPLINLCKNDIVRTAIEHNVALELTRSCYIAEDKHCGMCESCVRLRRALDANNCIDIIEKLF